MKVNEEAFAQAIQAEVGALRRFLALLDQEQALLVKGQVEDLVELAQQKHELAAEVSTLDNQRNEALAAQGLSPDRSGVEAWFAARPEAAAARDAWSTLIALATRAQETNDLNGELIQKRMQNTTQALEALLGTPGSRLTLYGPDGQSTVASGRRISDSA